MGRRRRQKWRRVLLVVSIRRREQGKKEGGMGWALESKRRVKARLLQKARRKRLL
jgi:hypothetical protein